MVVEVFGRYSGHTALRGGIGADADCILIPEIPVDFKAVYEHLKKNYMRRIRESDVKAGTYTIVVAEGIRDVSGKELIDESAGIDAFGHYKLAGAGKYVRDQISKMMKQDPEIKEFMKAEGMYVPGVYENPEVREVTPGHLIRSGNTSAFDVTFGLEAGAAAVSLLLNKIVGVTVVNVIEGEIKYMQTKDAIVQRHVELSVVSFYETLGVNFGRKPVAYSARFKEFTGKIERHI
jgi:6-phosphofructokinase 1